MADESEIVHVLASRLARVVEGAEVVLVDAPIEFLPAPVAADLASLLGYELLSWRGEGGRGVLVWLTPGTVVQGQG